LTSNPIRADAVIIVDAMTDPTGIAAADAEGDETAFWLALPGLRESLAEAEGDCVAGRTFGEHEIRARCGLPPLDTAGDASPITYIESAS
jgi:hypothetical protein